MEKKENTYSEFGKLNQAVDVILLSKLNEDIRSSDKIKVFVLFEGKS